MATLSSFFSSALDLSFVAQTVQDNIPGHAALAFQGIGSGASYVREGINAKVLGTKRTIKTSLGQKEVVELGPLGGSANVTKVQDCDTEKYFVLKRMEMDFSSGFIHLDAIKEQEERTKLLPALAESDHLVKCFGTQQENTGKIHAQVMVFELCGESLADLVSRQKLSGAGPLAMEQIVSVLDDVAHGLHCLHTAETGPMVHGSVRAEHIFRSEKGGWKLGGFGSSKACTGPLAAAADIEQLGLLAYELVFGASLSEQKPSEHAEADDKVALLLPDKRPRCLVEGRLVLLLHWMLVACPDQRATAKEVGIFMEDFMEARPQAEVMRDLPKVIASAARNTCDYLIFLLLKDALSQIQGSDRRALMNRYGEELFHDPTRWSPDMQQKFLKVAGHLDRALELRKVFGFEEFVALKFKPSGEAEMPSDAEQPQDPGNSAPMDLLDLTQEPMIDLDSEARCQPQAQTAVEMFDLL